MSDLQLPAASLRLRIDGDALAQNWRFLDRHSGDAQAGAAVKADAYGLGVANVVPHLLDAGARQFFLAHWSEVPALLDLVDGPAINVLHGVRNADEAAYALATGVTPVINSLEQAAIWNAAGGGRCHVMIDTGINRLGIAREQVGDPAIQALDIDIAMSHLASADEMSGQNAAQLEHFLSCVPTLGARKLSLANSAGIMLGSEYHFDVTRPGISLYGGVVAPAMEGRITQVAFPEAAVLQVRDLTPGESVGYNAKWTADRPVRAATVSLGYADGFLRALGPEVALQHGENSLQILGKVSMDMVVVDVTGTQVQENDFLEVPFDIVSISRKTGMSQYELLTVIGHRFDRN